jgi:hypothetical protein
VAGRLAEVTAGALVLASAAGGTHHIPFGQIFSITEPEPFTVRITLADAGFRVAAVHGQGLAIPAARPNALAQALAGQAPHDGQWPERIAGLLAN